MQLSPTYRAVLAAIPDLSWIYRFIPKIGRGRCPWIHGMTKAGHKVARFLKKGLIRFNTWLNDSEVASSKRDRIYTVTQDKCTCPEWRHRVSKGKAYRHIPGFFKGYVNLCKHQVAQWLRMHDVSHFSEFIEVIKPEQKLYEVSEVDLPPNVKLENVKYWENCDTFEVYHNRERIGIIEGGAEGIEASTLKGYRHTFPSQHEAIKYLLKQQELSASRDLFGDDMYPEEPESPAKKPQKKWFSLSDLSS